MIRDLNELLNQHPSVLYGAFFVGIVVVAIAVTLAVIVWLAYRRNSDIHLFGIHITPSQGDRGLAMGSYTPIDTPSLKSSYQTVRMETRVASSDFRLERALLTAKEHVYVAGQNLFWLVQNKNISEAIVRFLMDGSERTFSLLLCDPASTKCVDCWSTINPAASYREHLAKATEFVRILRGLAKARGCLYRLEVRLVDVFPLELMFIDPLLPQGYLALQPIVNHGHVGGDRPQYLLTRRENPEAYGYYWTCFNSLHTQTTAIKN